ncbi:MAG: DUF4837 family protein [Bacteroidales bacterium]|nr:DUF4837 family protein [Bacteroidales bacterium]
MKRNILIAVIIIATMVMTSCKESALKSSKPGSTGVTYELLVVSPDWVWDGSVGETVREFFQQTDTTLLMVEPLYKLPHITQKQFDDNQMFQCFKSLLFIEIDPGREAKVETRDTVWASPQRIFRIIAPTEDAFKEVFDEYKEYLLTQYNDLERIKLNRYYSTGLNNSIIKQVGEKFGYTFNITTGFYIAKNKQDFMWLRSETSKTSTNFLIYAEDYTSEEQLKPGYIALKRDLITKENVPASLDNSYAKISTEFPYSTKSVNVNGLFAVEMRGAWDCENDVMGGTFINYSFVDEVNNKILTIDGFIYAPNKEKRVFMMQLEAMIWSIRRYIA